MAECWALAEFPGDVEILARPGNRWLALTPVAMEELDARGWPYLIDGEICSPGELNRIGELNFARAERLAEAYDRKIFEYCPPVRRVGLPPFRGHFTRVKFLLDAVTTRLCILRCLTGEGVAEIRKTRPPGLGQPTDCNLFYGGDASLYGDLLDILATQTGVPVTWASRPAIPSLRSGRLGPREAARQLRQVGQGLGTALRATINRHARSRRILLLSEGYELGRVAERCHALGADVFLLDLAGLRLYRIPGRWPCRINWPSEEVRQIQEAVQRLELFGPGDPAEELCRDNGISYAPLVRRALARYLRTAFPRAVAARALLEACHRRLSFDLVLSPSGPDRIEVSVVFDFCRRAGIPVTVVQHGAYGYADNPITTYSDFGFDGDFLAWGPGVEVNYGGRKHGAVRFISVGAPSLDDLLARRERTALRPRRVMYVINLFRGYSAYFPGGQPCLDTAYYRFQRQILSLLERYQDTYDIWLKLHPATERNFLARNPVRQWLRERGSRITVEERPLLEVIDEPGLFIIDFPSTTLLQCLATRAQIIVFTGAPHFAVLPEARALLEKRAVCCDFEEEFLDAIEVRLREGIRPESGGLDDTFLSTYGTFRSDGRSLDRILAYVEAARGRGKDSTC